MIDYSTLLFGFLGLCGTGWLGWISVQSFRQGLRLSALPKAGGAALEEGTLAARGQVKVLVPLTVRGAFPCLWYRERVEEPQSWFLRRWWDSSRWKTISDDARMATFAIMVEAQKSRWLPCRRKSNALRPRSNVVRGIG